ncbi:glycosyltransferase [Sinorhizobium meliloti WSM1022]|jgi:glycosyltransferase involved in cell wall biosynthesis|uniref:Group 1 glycosyl transferase n=4 Tax=Sinorhizobium TaxID=28105 RepID=H0G0J2_RHIML|nr:MULTISPECIES: glycosyltransferase [Sinorhizobium]AEG53211.1 glycosyl transferase group 1 [Sinorhizobium meliloti AK83]ASP76961.1 glycosyl transferase [Sinorhizobium meliloti]ASQ04133.1 glycosyl transferase [Sinorhizobium meliloti]EHK77180.1 group 1 glycosyl transferase [Sinorhizobium meliloti CCNWSX0020]KKA13405.1 lipopolysaccharide biosynthesis protein [Sinorhizobium meliloti]
MKVTHFHFGKDGGAERFFVHLVNALAERGVEQTAIIRPGRGWRRDIEGAAKIRESHFRNLSLDRILLPLKVKHMARREKPDVLMAWAPRASELMPNYKGAFKISRLGDYPTRLSYFRNTDCIVCNTPGIAERVSDLGWKREIRVISNFTGTGRVVAVDRAKLDTPADAPVVMSMGRFVERKGFHTLIEAVARLPGVYLWLLGDGEERDNLHKLATDLGVSGRVRFAGWQDDTRPFLAAADVFVMSSSHEPLGNVILESWAQGTPVVSTRSEGPQWFMRDGENGLMVDIGDAEGFARAIEQIVADNSLRTRLAERGHETLVGQFSREAITDAYLQLFASKP